MKRASYMRVDADCSKPCTQIRWRTGDSVDRRFEGRERSVVLPNTCLDCRSLPTPPHPTIRFACEASDCRNSEIYFETFRIAIWSHLWVVKCHRFFVITKRSSAQVPHGSRLSGCHVDSLGCLRRCDLVSRDVEPAAVGGDRGERDEAWTTRRSVETHDLDSRDVDPAERPGQAGGGEASVATLRGNRCQCERRRHLQ